MVIDPEETDIEILRNVSYCTYKINPLTPNDHYSGRTAPLTSKRCILYVVYLFNKYKY